MLSKSRLCSCGCDGYHTLQAILSIVSWSFQKLASGEAPTCRHDGRPWSAKDLKDRLLPRGGGIPRAAMLQVRGDQEFLQSVMRFKTSSMENFCWMCEATLSSGPLCYHKFTAEAPHRASRTTHAAYIESCAASNFEPSKLFLSPGMTLDHVSVDTMHAGDLGVFQDVLGSVLFIEISNKQWHGSRSIGMARVNAELKQYYAANRDRKFSPVHLTVQQIIGSKKTKNQYPYLKAKAAQTRHLCEFVLVLAYRHMRGDEGRAPLRFSRTHHLSGREDEHLREVVNMMEGLVGYHRACAATPFDEAAATQCKQEMYRVLSSLQALHNLWREGLPEIRKKVQPFHLRPKAHILQHLVEDKLSLWGSPQNSWCYRDEDFVGAIKVVAMIWIG